ncbi:beta-lactamase family protein [Streptomyces sp. NBC_01275]|uniref:serine hydrolase domain-containing protein n=1 Tax=Streptomyces sp. NBC_01275 TaxID=2903807 RepID=UPI0022598FD2|nr:serine hydrolase domain-containing protein [Streptomyces sp. NBC_01275]MCX4764530.1 beta-lactamase family protein [Streptomyces sp. NBC_01275]
MATAALATVLTVGDAVPAMAAGAVPAVGTHQHQTLDKAALRAALSGLPDANVSGGLIRMTGRDGRWTDTAGPSVPSPDAHFRIGSITKLFTSTVVLQLAAEQRLSLDDTVQDLLPGLLPSSYRPVTVGQLLSHTSGLQIPLCARKDVPPREWVESALSCGEPTEPGKVTQYNGINYFIAGLIVEQVSGHSYGDEVRTRILRPLNLRDTSVPTLDDWSIPVPYTRGATVQPGSGSDELTDVSVQSPYAWAEGGMISNAPDLSRFLTALYQGRLLPPAQQETLFTLPTGVTGTRQFTYGGLERTVLPNGTTVWGKSGSYPGYTSGVFATRDLRRVLVYSLNPTGRTPELPYVMRIAEAAF